jgi:atypical dual specificity phosphatase
MTDRSPDLGFVDWVYEDRLGAMALPSASELERLKDAGVGTVITLTEEWHNPSVFREAGLHSVYIPVVDMTAPTMDQVREFVAEVNAAFARGERVVVHCLGGLGRTGTMIACYLVSAGLAPEAAIREVRRKRPGSIQTLEQEAAVWEWWAEEKSTHH